MLADRFPRGPAVPAAKCWRAMGSDWGLKKSVRRGIGCRTICDRKNLTAHTQLPSSFSFCACVSARTEFPSWKPKAFSSFFLSFYFFSGAIDWAQVRKISQGADGAAHGRQHSLVTVCIPLRQRQQTKAGDAHVSSGSSIIFFFAKEKKKRIFFPPKDGFSVTAWPESANIIPLFVAVYLNEDGQEQRQLVDGPPTLHRCFCFTIRSLVDETVDTTAASEPASEKKI